MIASRSASSLAEPDSADSLQASAKASASQAAHTTSPAVAFPRATLELAAAKAAHARPAATASAPASEANPAGRVRASTNNSLDDREPPLDRSSRTRSLRSRRTPTGSSPMRREVRTSTASSSVHGVPSAARRIVSSGDTAGSLCRATPSPSDSHGMSAANKSDRIDLSTVVDLAITAMRPHATVGASSPCRALRSSAAIARDWP